jgi:aspartate/methionine/tyrosine aminotransferase
MKIETFEMERLQSQFENVVECDLSESGTRAVSLQELSDWGFDFAPLMRTPLGYSQTNGTIPLREGIARMYPGATANNIMVTNGSAEAAYLVFAALVDRDGHVAIETPNFLQARGLGAYFSGRSTEAFRLRFDANWEPDWEEFERAVRPGCKLVYLTNPNNPTGKVLTDAARERVVRRCEEVGAWLLSDEVYIGSEIDRPRTETLYATSERVIVASGLSKAFAMPGVRIGWLVGPPWLAAEAWRLHDYTTIGPGKLSDAIATFAVREDIREKLFERTKRIVREQLPLVHAFVKESGGRLELNTPDATAMVLIRWRGPETSGEICKRLLEKRSTLVVDGKLLGLDGFIRVWSGAPRDRLVEGLRRFSEELHSGASVLNSESAPRGLESPE